MILHADTFLISPYVFSCFVALTEKKLPFEIAGVALERGSQRDEAYLAKSLTGRVPCLEDDGFFLAESSAIVEYLDDVHPETPMLPRAPRARARARQVMAWLRSDLMPIREERPTITMFYERATEPLSAQGQRAAERLAYVASKVIPEDGGYLFGDVSVADADLAFMLHRLILNDHPLPPRVTAWAKRVWERPSIQAFVGKKREPYVPYSY